MKKFTFIALFLVFIATFNSNAKYAQSDMMMGGDIGIGIPLGTASDYFNTGFGLNGVFSYFITPDVVFTGTLGYWSFGVKGGNASGYIIPLNAGINYRFPSKSTIIPYIGLETLLNITGYSTSSYDYFGNPVSNSHNEADFGFTPLFGIAIKAAPNFEIRASMRFHILFSNPTMTLISLMGGAHFYI